MTKYLVSGYIGFDNFGDELIARVLTDKLKKEGAEKITLISSNPKRTAELHGVESCGMLKFFKPLIESDVLISGGGSLLQDVTSLKSLIYYLGVIYTALILGKKVEIFAQGIGPINSKFGRILTRFALKFASAISVRDKKSQELLKSWGIDAELVKDPAFSLVLSNTPHPQPLSHKGRGEKTTQQDIFTPDHKKRGENTTQQDIFTPDHKGRGENVGVIGVQLRNFPTLSDEFLNSLACKVREKYSDKKIKVISLQDSIDLEVCEKFAKMLDLPNVEVLSGLSINDVLDTISGLEYLYAMRFHANVIAIKCNIPTTAINYDIKVQKLAEEYNLPLMELC